MRCANCRAENLEGRKFCTQCGSPLAAKCRQCGAATQPGERFCGECGTPLGAYPAAALGRPDERQIRMADTFAPESLEGERKIITALFADIKGSMELIEDLDPEEARAIVHPALKLMMEAVQRYGGYVAQSTGDGIFALFGAPVAHEDHPQRALYAALRMQQELKRYSDRIRAEGRLPIQARVGVNTGEVVVQSIATGKGRSEYVPVGHSTGIAARMQALAPVGSIAATEQIRKLCEGYFVFKSLGPTKIKGVSEPVNIYEVIGLGLLRTRLQRAAARGYTKFVGREREMEAIKHAADVAKSGHGQIVAAVAEPGVGKSRLFHEFKARNQSGWLVLEAVSVSHGKASAYLPLIDLLHGYFEIAAEDDARRRRQKLLGKLMDLDRSLEDALPYLFTLLGIVESEDPLAQMDAQIRRRRTQDAVKRVLLRESLNQPLMVIFEDLHWIDEETQAVLNVLIEGIAKAPLLLLVNYRPEYSHAWGSKTNYTQLRLDPLGKESAGEMLTTLVGDSPELAPLKRLVLERAEGNPLFMEELIEALFEEGVVVKNGAIKLAKPLGQVKIPQTVQDILSARVDRLPPEAKELLQTLAVIGMEFPLLLVREIVQQPPEQLDNLLSGLQTSELIYEQPASGDLEYTFKHALIHDVAYSSVLQERRKVIHERIGKSIETLYAETLDDHIASLAHHYQRSANAGKAVTYLLRAGDQAHQRSAFSVAAEYFENASERLKELPSSAERDRMEYAIHTGLADVTLVTRGYAAPGYERLLIRRYELALRLKDTRQQFYAVVGTSVLSAFRLELGRARELADNLVQLADLAMDPGMQLEAHGSLANTLWLLGDFIGSRAHSEKGIALFAPEEHRPLGEEHWRAACLFYAPLCTANQGFRDQALRQSLESLALAQKMANAIRLAYALNCVSTLYVWRGDGSKALKYADSFLALTAEHAFSNLYSLAQIVHGQALALVGNAAEAVAEIKGAMSAFEATGAVAPGWLHSSLGFAYLAAHNPQEGLRAADKALDIGDRTGDAEAKSDLHRLRGESLLRLTPKSTADAEASFRAAIDTARKQHGKSAELVATTSLARLLRNTNRRDEARTILAEIYNWFTEGFDSADLKEAGALLDEISA
jgi:class 3 adenylate cyclase